MMNKIAPGAMILDAGYPKNLKGTFGENGLRVIDGGLGFVSGGFCTIPRFYKSMYSFARAGLAHGCLLEAVVLALEKRFETFSAGRGNIRLESMEEINKMAEKHGIIPGPPWREGISRWSMTDGR